MRFMLWGYQMDEAGCCKLIRRTVNEIALCRDGTIADENIDLPGIV
jgi:hypothetical protein